MAAGLLLALTLTLTACGGSRGESTEAQPTEEQTTAPETEQTTEEATEPAVTDPLSALVGKPLSEVDPEILREILVQTALAYYYKNPYCQYNMTTNLTAQGNSGSRLDTQGIDPEFITEDEPYYSHCRSYCSEVYESAFGWDQLPSVRSGWPGKFSTFRSMIVMQYSYNPRGILGLPAEETYTDQQLFIKDFLAALQPGDIMYGEKKVNTDGGHIMIYLGDCFGDGKRWCLHSWPVGGGVMETSGSTKGVNKREPNGSITLQTLDELVLRTDSVKNGPNPNWSFAGTNADGMPNQCYIWLIRPTQDEKLMSSTLLTEENVARIRYPHMNITRSIGKYATDSLVNGEELTVSVTVDSKQKAAFEQIPVIEQLPEGAELVAGSVSAGGTQEGNTLRWTVDVAAGKTETVSYKVKVTAKAGETVKFPSGSVSGIDTKNWELKVAKTALSAEQQERLQKLAAGTLPKSLKTGAYQGMDFVNQVYTQVVGLETAFPKTVAEYAGSFLENKRPRGMDQYFLIEKTELTAAEAELKFSTITRNVGGYHVYLPQSLSNADRQLEYLEQFYEVGDVFLISDCASVAKVLEAPTTQQILICLGGGKLLQHDMDGTVKVVDWKDSIERAILNSLVIGVRPAMIFDKQVTPTAEAGEPQAEAVNLARTATVTTTYPLVNGSVYPLSMINDGISSVGSSMCALKFDRADGEILFDLGSVCEVEEYRLFGYEYATKYSLVTGWTLYGSEDGETYTELDSGKIDTAGFNDGTKYASGVKGGKPDGKAFAEPVKARYMKLVITDCLKGSETNPAHIRFYEVEFMGRAGEAEEADEKVEQNLALKAEVTTTYKADGSFYQNGGTVKYPVKNIADGNHDASASTSCRYAWSEDGYILFDLGAVHTVNRYELYNYEYPFQWCINKSWTVYGSEDGVSFTELAKGSIDTSEFGSAVNYATGIRAGAPDGGSFAAPVQARYIKLVVDEVFVGEGTASGYDAENCNSKDVRIYECCIWGY